MRVSFDNFHNALIKGIKPKYAFSEKVNFKVYQDRLRKKFIELLCIDKIKENACALKVDIEKKENRKDYTFYRFTVETEKGNHVPCMLLVPKGKKKYDVAITLQGHTNGMYHSIGEVRNKKDKEHYKITHAYALQAVKNGYAALCIELRGMGELQAFEPDRCWENGGFDKFNAYTSLILGRVLEGERVWDVSKVIDILPRFKELNTKNIFITGCSGGGTLSFYAACYDKRIKMSAPDCAFCPYLESILAMYHCVCNYIPHAYEYFDMPDLAALIAPRKLLILAGAKDPIFPLNGVRRGYNVVKKIYKKIGAPNNVKLVETPTDHTWHAEAIWPAINKFWKQ